MSRLIEFGLNIGKKAWSKAFGSNEVQQPTKPESLSLLFQAINAAGAAGQLDLAKTFQQIEARMGTNAAATFRSLLMNRDDLIRHAGSMEGMQITTTDIDNLIITEMARAGVVPQALVEQQMQFAQQQRAMQPKPWPERMKNSLFGGLDPFNTIDNL